MRKSFATVFCLALLLCAGAAQATVIDFEDLPDLADVGDTYAGLHFTNAISLTAGFSLNEIDFPPFSGLVAVGDNGGPLQVLFDTPVDNLFGYFTHGSFLTFSAFDAGGNLLESFTTDFESNLGSSSLFSFTVQGISALTIAGQAPDSFIIDNLSFDGGNPSVVPEPATFLMLGSGLVGVALRLKRKAAR